MDRGFRFLCQAETRKLISLLGIMAALVLAFQYFELPNSTLLSSLTAKITSFTMDDTSLLNSKVEGNKYMNVSDSRFKHAIEEVPISPQYSPLDQVTSSGVHNGSGLITSPAPDKVNGLGSVEVKDTNLTSQGVSLPSSPLAELMVPFPNRTTSLDSEVDSKSPIMSVISTTTSLKSNTSDPDHKDGGSGSLQGSNVTLSLSNDKPVSTKNSKKKSSKVVLISEMNLQLQHIQASSQLPKSAKLSAVDLELLHAKSEIENAPIIMDDSRLYSPLYRNVSMFRRSYELMEKMLKVYIYQDGDRPIFHEPLLNGAYASEGWFMKLMEENKQFVSGDPSKAHLFYIPFSSRLLQLTLYVKNSHKRLNLIEYMKNHVDMIARKYPFWNRTNGTDHFVVASHDWAPAETRGRMLNCIRALGNADIEVGFEIGKDVCLPQTYIRSIEDPAKNIGGNPPSQRPILAFFAGGLHGYVRPVLLKHWENKEPDMKISGRLPDVRGNANYIEFMKSSKYCICARGYEVNTPRVVEALLYECVPVIISDNFIPPLFEVLNWESFAVFVMEKDIPDLRNILLSISEERYLEMHKRVKKVQEHFLWHHEPVKYDLFHMLLHSIWYNRLFRVGQNSDHVSV